MSATISELLELDGKDKLAVSGREGQILYSLVKRFDPKVILEVGTGHGYSSLWISLAMSPDAKFYTIDSVERPHLFEQPKFKNGKDIQFILGRLEERYSSIPDHLDFAFLDTTHTLTDVVYDVEAVSPLMDVGGVIVVHDTVFREEMGGALSDYFKGIHSNVLKSADINPPLGQWQYENFMTEYGLGVAIKQGKGKVNG